MTSSTGKAQAFKNRRTFDRFKFISSVDYRIFANGLDQIFPASTTCIAHSRDISEGGILFLTHKNPPLISSPIWINANTAAIKLDKSLKDKVLYAQNGFIGKVVRVSEINSDSSNLSTTYEVGVKFILKGELPAPALKVIEQILKLK